MSVVVRAPETDGDWEQFAAVEGQAFATTPEETDTYIASVRPNAIARFGFEGDRVVGGALAFASDQYIGGRPVPGGAVASVCVAPEHRGTGVGRSVMWSLVQAMRDEGVALSPLWPTSVAFYRSMGWELAGQVTEYSVPAVQLRGHRADGLAERDPPLDEIRRLRTSIARRRTGPLERPDWWWNWRLPTPAKPLTYRYGWREGGELTGFVVTRHDPEVRDRVWGFDVWVTDFWAATANALHGLAGLVGSDAPLSPKVRFAHGVLPDTPDLAWRLPELSMATTSTNAWMLRVLDPTAAIERSGWPRHMRCRIAVEVAGVGQPSSRIDIAFADGDAHVTPSDAPRVLISAGAFAAWYAGALPASRAAMLGLASGPPEDLELMDTLTVDRRPWLPDMF